MIEKSSISIVEITERYYEILKSITSRSEALKNIAARATEDFGEFIIPGNLNLTDEIEINFAELLDQIIYEFKDNTEYEANIRDYIIDDLYSRLYIYLESYNNITLYLQNIKNRPLTPDDLLIIKKRKLAKAIPLLIAEYDEITLLQKPIIKTLLYLAEDSPDDFFLDSLRKSSHPFIRSASILGLKYRGADISSQVIADPSLRDELENYSTELLEYAENFNFSEIWKNREPAKRKEITFALLHIEKNIHNFNDNRSINWILNILSLVPEMNFENSWLNEINTSMSNILLSIDISGIKEFLNSEEKLLMIINFIDLFPKNIFNRLTGRLDELGIEFHYRLNSILEKNEFKSGDLNSNMLNYLSWNNR